MILFIINFQFNLTRFFHINFILLSLIKNNYSNEEICKKLNITNKELKRRIESLKYEGFNICKSYNYDAQNKYILNKKKLNSEEIVTIHSNPNQKDFRALVIADNHIGHVKDNLSYTEIMYDYCKKIWPPCGISAGRERKSSS